MAETSIEWTDATWNPVRGCKKVSPGCANCYAELMTGRLEVMGNAGYAGLTKLGADGKRRLFTGEFRGAADMLDLPLRRRKPTTFFVNSMSDLFGEGVSDEFIAAVFGVMAACPQHTFQVLTKRAGRMARWFQAIERQETFGIGKPTDPPHYAHPFKPICDACKAHDVPVTVQSLYEQRHGRPAPWPLPNVWLGVSVESQEYADERIPHLLRVSATVPFLSCEPLLGPLDLRKYLDRIKWVIVGGESGNGARPMHPDWARSLRDQCQAAGVPYFHKQNGEFVEVQYSLPRNGDLWVLGEGGISRWKPGDKGATAGKWSAHADVLVRRIGKKAAGRLLDGRTWDEMPEARP